MMARILVADCSDPEFSTALARVLALKGFGTVGTECNGTEELWLRVLAERPDLLLVDRKNGAEIIERLRATPRRQQVRVLVVDSDRNIDREVPGADGYIQCPAPPNIYVQAVRDALSA
ncbi:MAG: response regulator transcription factor [Deltaproteobacteria bacterium]|nr:response regulator transcription factor [Deltaproteobacteria bacterium]